MVLTLGLALWIFTILVPEYCLTANEDAESMGAGLMGQLVAVITLLPEAVLGPLVIIYGLQYLGRVLVSSILGETVPPRTPDRNFDGLFNGLSPWLFWLLLGAPLALALPGFYLVNRGEISPTTVLVATALLLPGLPYASMALIRAFLDERPLAASPPAVLADLVKVGGSFGSTCLASTFAIFTGLLVFTMALTARDNHFVVYLTGSLIAWLILVWALIIVVRMLGVFAYHHREALGGNAEPAC
jgi:hypothetical protein